MIDVLQEPADSPGDLGKRQQVEPEHRCVFAMLFAVQTECQDLAATREVKRARQPVPDRKHAAEVLVAVLWRGTVMEVPAIAGMITQPRASATPITRLTTTLFPLR